MLSFNEALKLLKKSCSDNVVKHCLLVSKKSYELAKKIEANGVSIDVELCRVGGLLHDIGRSETHSLSHGVKGAEILKDHPVLARIAETHIGGGIPKDEAEELGLSSKDLMPESVEQKVVCYADKLVQDDKFSDNASEEIKKLEDKLGKDHGSIKRLRRLEDEINKLIKKA